MTENFVRDLMRFTSNLHFAGKSLVLTSLLIASKIYQFAKSKDKTNFYSDESKRQKNIPKTKSGTLPIWFSLTTSLTSVT